MDHDASADQGLDLALHRLAAVVVVIGWLVSAVFTVRYPEFYQPGVAAGSLAILGVGGVWCLLDCRATARRRIGIKVFVTAAVLLMGLQPLVVTGLSDTVDPPLVHVLAVGACLSPLAFGPRVAIVVAVWWGAVFALLRRSRGDGLELFVQSGLVALTVGVCTAALSLVWKASAAVSSAAEAERIAAESAARVGLRLREKERSDLVLHDLVLGALIIAARVGDRNRRAAAQLAADALRFLAADESAEPESLSALLSQQADRLDLDLITDVLGDVHTSSWPRDAWDAVSGAVTEALVNIARHSGQRQAVVSADLDAHRADIVVSDAGRGFDLAAVDPSRAGVRRGILRRMRAVGGDAVITARPGVGVVVSISWSDGRAPSTAPADWDVRTFGPLAALGFSLLVFHVLSGVGHQSAGATVLIAFWLLALTALIWGLPRRSRWWPAPAIALMVMAIVIVGALQLGPLVDARYWFAGAIGPAVAGLSFKYRPWSGIVVVLGSAAGAAAAVWWSLGIGPGTMLVALLPAYADPMAAAIGASFLSRALDAFSVHINSDNRATIELQIEAARREIRVAEIGRRQQALRTSVIPMLRRIADGAELDQDSRLECQVMEQTARDQLVATSLVASAELADTVLDARHRGVTVILSAEDSGDHGLLAGFRRVLSAVLRDVPARSVVRAKWRPRGASLGTVVVVGGDPLDSDIDRWRHTGATRDVRLEASRDEESVLLELLRSP